MGRELFSSTLAPATRPPRSKWTIAGSILFHTVIVGALLIVPVFATMEVPTRARTITTMFVPPPPRLPDIPPPPSAAPKTPPVNLNPEAAPVESGTKIPTEDTPIVSPGPVASVPGGLPGPIGRSAPSDFLQGTGLTTLAAPPKPAPVRPGGDIKPPQRIVYVPPIYPTIAQTAKIEGLVILEATIDEQGIVRDVKVLRSIPMLDKAAIEAVTKWRYTPTRLNGVPVPIILSVTVSFSLK